MKSIDLTAERLRELLVYDQDTGVFTNRDRRNSRAPAGAISGGLIISTGYWRIVIDGAHLYAHRLAWLYVYGSWPEQDIDHIDGDKANNRIANLRDVPHAVNIQNRRRPQSNGTSGYLGVSWNSARQRWEAQIRANGRNRALGYFDTALEASAAYMAAKSIYHPEATINQTIQE